MVVSAWGSLLRPKTKEAAYILGLLWADGTFYKKGYYSHTYIKLKYVDGNALFPIFRKTGPWRRYTRIVENRKYLQMQCSNPDVLNFLRSYGYKPRRTASPTRIIDSLPPRLRRLWWRGFIDGDGCFYQNATSCQITLTGRHHQNWRFALNLCDELGVENHCIARRTHKGGRSSYFRVSKKLDCVKIGNYIYNGRDEDRIGLLRKYKRYKKMVDLLPDQRRSQLFLTHQGKTKTIKEWARYLGLEYPTLLTRYKTGRSVPEILSPRRVNSRTKFVRRAA